MGGSNKYFKLPVREGSKNIPRGELKYINKNGGRVDKSNKKWGEAKERKQKMGGG